MFAGFDIGGTNARGSLFNADWEIAASGRERVRGRTEPDEVAGLVDALLEDLLERAGAEAVDALGVGIAGQLDAEGRTVRNSPNLGWRDVPFARRLEERLELPDVRLVNDLSASLWGERSAGAVRDVDDVLAVFVGTGVGGAVLADGRPIVGSGGVAGEIGHAKIEPGGRLCGCGERGCLEAYAGGIHLERRVEELAADHSELEDLLEEPGEVDLGGADDRARTHDRLGAIWRRATDGLAVVAANACTLLDPSVLLAGGGVLEHCEYFREEFVTKFTPLVLEAVRADLEIRRPVLGDEAGVRGAARLAARGDV